MTVVRLETVTPDDAQGHLWMWSRLTKPNASLSFNRTLRTDPETDDDGIPIRPTWSINQLLSSHHKLTMPPATMKRLHSLSVSIPPEEGSEHAKLTEEMQDLVKLVEAVKPVNTGSVDDRNGIPDERIWAESTGIGLDAELDDNEVQDRDLLKLRAKNVCSEGLYLVGSDRSR